LFGTVLDFTLSSPVDARRVATKIIESKSASVAGQPAHEVVFDLVNLDQLQLDPQAPRTRIRAMFIVTRTKKTLGGTRRVRRPAVPAVLFVGYSAVAGTFDSQIPVLEDLLARIHIASGK
jgi:hypothetical protein